MRRVFNFAAALSMVFVWSAYAKAAGASASLTVSANVAINCTISTSPVAFGVYDPIGVHAATPADATGLVSVACTKGTAPTVGLDLGSNASGTTRQMTNGTDVLTYELYQDAGHATVWGNSGADVLSPGAAPSSAARDFTVYGRIPAAQDIGSGAYVDTVTATVNF